MTTTTHTPQNITSGTALGDDSYYSTCATCGADITLFGVYDDDRGVVLDKKWSVITMVESPRDPRVKVSRFSYDCN